MQRAESDLSEAHWGGPAGQYPQNRCPLPFADVLCSFPKTDVQGLTQLAASSFFLNGTLVSGSTMITTLTIQQPLMHRLELRAFNCLG